MVWSLYYEATIFIILTLECPGADLYTGNVTKGVPGFNAPNSVYVSGMARL